MRGAALALLLTGCTPDEAREWVSFGVEAAACIALAAWLLGPLLSAVREWWRQ